MSDREQLRQLGEVHQREEGDARQSLDRQAPQLSSDLEDESSSNSNNEDSVQAFGDELRGFQEPNGFGYFNREPQTLVSSLLTTARKAHAVLERQIGICNRHINSLIDNNTRSQNDVLVRENESGDEADDEPDENDALVERIVRTIDGLNGKKERLKAFIEARGITNNRDELKDIFNIIRHATEFDIMHPERREPILDRPSAVSLLAADMGGGGRNRMPPLPRVQQFRLDGNGPERLRNVLGQLFGGMPENFFDNVATPINDAVLNQHMPVVQYSAFVEKRKEQEKEANEECNVCLEKFQGEDNVRVFPCCEIAQHSACLEEWFREHDTCVVCRKKLLDTLGIEQQRAPIRERVEDINPNLRTAFNFNFQIAGAANNNAADDDMYPDDLIPMDIDENDNPVDGGEEYFWSHGILE